MMSALPRSKEMDKLRAEHQAKARLAAEDGLVPTAFVGDPTFLELVAEQDELPAPETFP